MPLTKWEPGDPWGRIEDHLGLLVVVLSGFGRLFCHEAGKRLGRSDEGWLQVVKRQAANGDQRGL
jgi:hypothetical protein